MRSRHAGSAQPPRLRRLERDLVAPGKDSLRHETTHGVAQDALGDAVPAQERGREREGELGHAAIEIRQPHLAGMGHAAAVGVAQERGQAGHEALQQQLASHRRSGGERRHGRGDRRSVCATTPRATYGLADRRRYDASDPLRKVRPGEHAHGKGAARRRPHAQRARSPRARRPPPRSRPSTGSPRTARRRPDRRAARRCQRPGPHG